MNWNQNLKILPIQYVSDENPCNAANVASSEEVRNVARRAPGAFKAHCTEA